MAVAIKAERHTLADDLRQLLARSEERLINVANQAEAAELYAWFDQIDQLWPEVRALGADVRAEEARWQSLQERLVARGAKVLRAWQGSAGLAAARQVAQPAAGAWWWRLDQVMAQKRRAALRRVGLLALAVAALLVVASFALPRLFPVDPAVRAAYRLQNEAERALASGDVETAFRALSEAIAVTPDNYSLLISHGVVAEMLGQNAVAEQSWQQARTVLQGNEARFLAERGLYYLRTRQTQRAAGDAEAAIALDPSLAEAQLVLGGALEELGRYQEAVSAYEQAAALAEASDRPQLTVMARTQMANLLQRIQSSPSTTPMP